MNTTEYKGGPRTPEGKAASSRNAVKHGATGSTFFLLQNENREAWERLLADCIEEFEPTNNYEHRLVYEIAFIKWRQLRSWAIESSLFDIKMDEQAEKLNQDFAGISEGARQGHAFISLSDETKSLSNVGLYQMRLERAYNRAVSNFEAKKKKRTPQRG